MTELEKHTEVVNGERRWRADSSLEERYQKIDEGVEVLMSDRFSFRDDLFAVLKEMGFEETSDPDVLSLDNVKLIWDVESSWISVRNKYRHREVTSLFHLCSTIRSYWGERRWRADSSVLDDITSRIRRRGE